MDDAQPSTVEARATLEPSPLSISDMLKWRSVVLGQALSESAVVWKAMYVESEDPAPKTWRDDAALWQQKKNKEKKKGSKETQPKKHERLSACDGAWKTS